jgi:hypothetical protein
VVIDVYQHAALPDAVTNLAETLVAGGIHGHHAVELHAAARRADETAGVKERVLGRHGILVPAHHLLPQFAQGQGDGKLGADAVAIRPDVADDAEGAAAFDGLKNTLKGFGGHFHDSGSVCSSSSMISRTRFPRSIESSIWKRMWGVYFSTTA